MNVTKNFSIILLSIFLSLSACRENNGETSSTDEKVSADSSDIVSNNSPARVCLNSATDFPSCSQCPAGSQMQSGQCVADCPTCGTYYVDFTGGSDELNDGKSEAKPFKHSPGDPKAISKAAAVVLKPGDRVKFKGGTKYFGSININASGEKTKPIIFLGNAWGEKEAVIDGSEPLKAWRQCESQAACLGNPNWQKIYYTSVSPDLSVATANLHEDDEFLWISQSPNMPDPFYMDETDYFYSIPKGDITRTSLIDHTNFNQSSSDYWNDSSVIVWVQPNVVSLKKITGFVPTEHKILTEDLGGDPYTNRDTRYSIYNSIHAIDSPGEYFIKESLDTNGKRKVFLWPRNPVGLDENRITYSVRQYGINLAGKSNIIIEGFKVQKMSGLGTRVGIGIGTQSNTTVSVSGIRISKNIVTHNRHGKAGGYGGIFLDKASNSIVENNQVIENPFHRGIFATQGNNVVVRGNRVEKAGYTAIGFYTMTRSQIIENEIINNNGTHANGTSLYLNCKDILYARNKVVNSNIAVTASEADNITLFGNLVDNKSRNYAFAIWSGGIGVRNVQIINNTFLNSEGNYSVSFSNVPGFVLKNNILDGALITGDVDKSNNIYTGLAWNQDSRNGWSLSSGESVETDLTKIFQNPGSGDFRLLSSGPAVYRGTNVIQHLPTVNFPDFDFYKDIDKNLRTDTKVWSIGAFEIK